MMDKCLDAHAYVLFDGYCLDYFPCRDSGVSHFKLFVLYLYRGLGLLGNAVTHRQ
jgi:hypothetical protein